MISQLHEVHPDQVSQWKAEMPADASAAFHKGKRAQESEQRSKRREEKSLKKTAELVYQRPIQMLRGGGEFIVHKRVRGLAIERTDQVWSTDRF